jgi:hypothetical protein
MSKIHVSDCPAGLVLDAAVAMAQGLHIDNLAGYWKDDAGNNVHPACVGCDGVPTWHPSGDIRAAWELVEDSKDCIVDLISPFSLTEDGRKWATSLINGENVFTGYASTAPLAIVRAYLLAHGVTEVEMPEEATVSGGDHGR